LTTAIAMPAATQNSVSLKALIATLLALLLLSNFLLLSFLGLPWWSVGPIAIICIGVMLVILQRATWARELPQISWKSIFVCAILACALLIAGGEGRLLYANYDWQIRDTVLADLIRNNWPYQYQYEGEDYILRAPLGMYLLPAALSKLGMGQYQDFILLACNTCFLTLLLSIGQGLFATAKARWIAFAVVVFFSGWDVVGAIIVQSLGNAIVFDHIEWWNKSSQYSSVITLLFWVPNHGFAGWACAILFLLYLKRMIPIGALAATMPLIAIWSPLVMLGAFPFAVAAGVYALSSRALNWRDIALTALALIVALPSLLYLRLDPGSVSTSIGPKSWIPYLFGLGVEVLPFVWLVTKMPFQNSRDKSMAWLAIGCLVVFPFYQIGTNSDFQMRATIMPLMIIALIFADFMGQAKQPNHIALAVIMGGVLAIGSITGLLEMRRAFAFAPSPKPLCNLTGVWFNQDQDVAALGTYLARRSTFPKQTTPPTIEPFSNPRLCWAKPWQTFR
jgi:hypothetical protein